MSFALTKIQRPRPRAGLLLARPALEQELVEALASQRVVLLCAAAGYGKTALLARGIERLPDGHQAAWISLDAGDDLHRLLECLVAALEPFDPPWRTAPEALIVSAQGGERARGEVVDELVNTLEACDVAHGVVVLDDVHHVDDPACLAFLERWLQRLGARWTVALAARHEPALGLARLRAAGEVAELRQSRLEFTRDEARELLARAGVEAGAIDALYDRTAGWPAGLRLALNGAPAGARGGAIDRQAFDFLVSEVVARIDPALREFLLLTCVLIDLDEPRCAALSGDAMAGARLEEIERLGLFATVVDDTRRTLRLHDLFRDALQHRLKVERRDVWLSQLARAASVEPDLVRRQALLLQANRTDEAARGLLGSFGLLTQGGVHALLRLCDQFPPGYAATSAELQAGLGEAKWALWETGQAERHFAQADALYTARGDTARALAVRAQRAITLVALGRLGEAGAALAALRAVPLEGDARRHTLLATLWHAIESGALFDVAEHFDALVQCLETTPVIEAWFGTVPAPRQSACRGVAGPLARWATGALAVVGDRPLPLRSLGILVQGWLALWQGRLDDAAQLLERAEADAQWTGRHLITRSHALALRALLNLASGAHDAALQTMRTRVAEHTAGYGDWGLWHTLFFAGRVAAACGDVQTLQGWLQRLLALQAGLPDATPARLRAVVGLQGTLAWLEGRRDAAMTAWRDALAHEAEADLLAQGVEVRVRLALALARTGAMADAAATMAPVLARVDDGPRGAVFCTGEFQALAAMDWRGRLDDGALATLRRWASGLQPAPSVAARPAHEATAQAAPQAVPQRLTGRELEVLERIARGESNKLIARAFDLSPYTVKRHVANILDKLGLASRGQAAAWFREHGRA
jgi:LuxR family maltose regulon positive regulatory protein